mgnify:CR=1 FL=1
MRYPKVLASISWLVFLVLGCEGGEAVTPDFDQPRGVGTLNIDMDYQAHKPVELRRKALE